MSISVALDKLAGEIAERGPGYLLTTGADGRPHTTQVHFTVDGDALRAPAGRKTAGNIGRVGVVSLLWPPTEAGDYSLIVDGDATIDGPEGGHSAVIVPTHAVLHRPAPDGPGHDCKDI